MTEGDAKIMYAKGAMEEDRDTGGMSMRYKDKRNETVKYLRSCCDLSDAALLAKTRRSQAAYTTPDLYIPPTVAPEESSSL